MHLGKYLICAVMLPFEFYRNLRTFSAKFYIADLESSQYFFYLSLIIPHVLFIYLFYLNLNKFFDIQK